MLHRRWTPVPLRNRLRRPGDGCRSADVHCISVPRRPRGYDPTPARISPMPKKLSAQARARKIKLLLFDVDGVLTDGKLFIFPAPAGTQQSVLEQSAQHGGQGGFGFHSQSLIEAKGFHAHDGTSISLARLAGIQTGLITKRISETVALRARDLRLEYVRQG